MQSPPDLTEQVVYWSMASLSDVEAGVLLVFPDRITLCATSRQRLRTESRLSPIASTCAKRVSQSVAWIQFGVAMMPSWLTYKSLHSASVTSWSTSTSVTSANGVSGTSQKMPHDVCGANEKSTLRRASAS